jgi:succinate dehydrogenase / fumarate reductase, flavoprotein subunit
LGASALMQGLADGYFVLPNTLANYIAGVSADDLDTSHEAFAAVEQAVHDKIDRLLSIDGERTVDSFHRELGRIMWDYCGMERSEESLTKALELIPPLREEFWRNVRVPGSAENLNQSLEMAGRVADFLELAELLCIDALDRRESCGAHFRVESQTADGEALRDDENYAYVAAWEYTGEAKAPTLHKEPLTFEYVPLSQRSYK